MSADCTVPVCLDIADAGLKSELIADFERMELPITLTDDPAGAYLVTDGAPGEASETAISVIQVTTDPRYVRRRIVANRDLEERNVADYAVTAALSSHWNMQIYIRGKAPEIPAHKAAQRTRIGVMGLGPIGIQCLKRLENFDFQLSAWSRRSRNLAELPAAGKLDRFYHGKESLADFLLLVDILICCTRVNDETMGILDFDYLSCLKDGAAVIDVTDGIVHYPALLEVMKSGLIETAVLDTMPSNIPQPVRDGLKVLPGVVITPHIAANPAALQIAGRLPIDRK